MSEHAVVVRLGVGGGWLPSPEQIKGIRLLEREMEAALAANGAGQLDGDEFGGGQVTLYLYGPAADRLLGSIEEIVRQFPATFRYADLRYGDVDDESASGRRVRL